MKGADDEVQGGGTGLGWSGGGSYLSADPLLFSPKSEVERLANSRGGRYIVVWIERRDEFDGRGRGGGGLDEEGIGVRVSGGCSGWGQVE